ncbi:GatB/YqeY domain-containing protein [Halalkalibacter oceani]|uniref:GatB/YqeY domain-containing protein n=1 Tax=Halalkalibacter oceani TaxID=1653776 RepID=A0A9X2DLA5_9BACI|nr:GatB/YqeY domain-containing protein [Halalkalibacter oceani]MCM3712826.1 GatB/YqeY domain-containing protein [Halalkalibacter oceani]MCM3761509.1 GatB/YqeY domain-containing protein [Halalkalibacter oceani]
MNLLERLNQDMKTAMKNKEKQKLSVIRMVKSSLQNEQIKLGRELTDDDSLTVLNRELKQRKDSLHEFEQANREDLASKLRDEITVLEDYMPEQLSDEEVSQIVQATIKEVGATTKADMGKVMGAIMPKVKGKADGGLVNRLVQQHLS